MKIFGKNRPKNEFPSQEAIDTLCLGLEFYQFENEERLHNWLKEFKEYEDFMTPEEYMEKFERPDFTKIPEDFEEDEHDY